MGNICPPNKNHSASGGINGRGNAYLTNESGFKVGALVTGGNGNVVGDITNLNGNSNSNNSSYPIVNIGNGNVAYGNMNGKIIIIFFVKESERNFIPRKLGCLTNFF